MYTDILQVLVFYENSWIFSKTFDIMFEVWIIVLKTYKISEQQVLNPKVLSVTNSCDNNENSKTDKNQSNFRTGGHGGIKIATIATSHYQLLPVTTSRCQLIPVTSRWMQAVAVAFPSVTAGCHFIQIVVLFLSIHFYFKGFTPLNPH